MRSKFLAFFGITCLALAFLVSACGAPAANTDQANVAENHTVLTQQDHYNKTQPIPFFDFSLRRQMLIDYYKAANQAVATYTYYVNMFPTAKAYLVCPSISIPIQGGTQLTNGLQAVDQAANGNSHNYNGGALAAIQQAEPDGTFAPANGQGTIILCVNDDGTASPVYAEPNVMTFPYKLAGADETLFSRASKSTMTIETKQHG